jgi:hypothetical protein
MTVINASAIIPSLLRGKRIEETENLTKEDLSDGVV